MQQIPETFRKSGYDYKLKFRCDKTAIYEQSDKDGIAGYELHIIAIAKEAEVFGKMTPEREILAGTNEWGTRAWTCTTLERAMEKREIKLREIKERKLQIN